MDPGFEDDDNVPGHLGVDIGEAEAERAFQYVEDNLQRAGGWAQLRTELIAAFEAFLADLWPLVEPNLSKLERLTSPEYMGDHERYLETYQGYWHNMVARLEELSVTFEFDPAFLPTRIARSARDMIKMHTNITRSEFDGYRPDVSEPYGDHQVLGELQWETKFLEDTEPLLRKHFPWLEPHMQEIVEGRHYLSALYVGKAFVDLASN
jgi:hypothetical protein